MLRRIWPAVTAMRPGRVAELVELDAAVRVPLPLSTRVGFIGVAGGTGCSTAAGLAAAVLVARRSRRMLAVNASRRARSLLWHAGLTGAATVGGQHTGAPADARHAADVTADLVTTPGGLYCMDLVDEPGADVDDRWWQTVAPVGRFFDFVVTDWGVREAGSSADVAASSTLVCVVAPADRAGLQHGVDLAHAMTAAGTPAMIAVVDAHRQITTAIRLAMDRLDVETVLIPYDRAHGAARPTTADRLRASTRLAAIRLSAALVRQASPAHAERATTLAPAEQPASVVHAGGSS